MALRTLLRPRRSVTKRMLRASIQRPVPIVMAQVPNRVRLDQLVAPGAMNTTRQNPPQPLPPQTLMLRPVTTLRATSLHPLHKQFIGATRA